MGNSMANRKKTQSPVTRTTARKTGAKKSAQKKAAPKKTAPKTKPQPAQEPNPAALFEQFNTLWTQKWGEMLRDKGWPDSFTPPDAGQMPFMLPFMMPAMGPTMVTPSATDPHLHALVSRLATLEQRIMELEAQLAQRSTNKPRKSGK